jgi:UDP-N-acetylmuramate dehydrogenase
MKILENVPLAPLTTFEIGGPARWFVEAASEEDIAAAVAWAKERSLPLFVLGGGSNLLIADAGFPGLVLKIALRGFEILTASTPETAILRAAAGEQWEDCVQQSLEANLAGLESLAGIPGTVGGTPVQNVGAYGQEVSSVIDRVRAYDRLQDRWIEFTNPECAFAYRHSRFNSTDRDRYIVTRVDYLLRRNAAPNIRYADLQRALTAQAEAAGRTLDSFSLPEVADAVRAVRRSKGMFMVPGEADCRSAGSFFKNPAVDAAALERIRLQSGQEPPHFPAPDGLFKVPAAWLIEKAGFARGFSIGAAGISTRHTLALTNRGGATAEAVLALAKEIACGVEARFGVQLTMEPVRVGFLSAQD